MSMYYIRSNFLLHQKPKTKKNTKKNKTFDWNPVLFNSFGFLFFFFFCILCFFVFLVFCLFVFLFFWYFFGVLVFGYTLVFHIIFI